MKLQRTTLILLFLALGLAGFVYWHEIWSVNHQQKAKANEQQIFPWLTAIQIQSIIVKTQKQTIELERIDNSNQPNWLMKTPIQTPASQAAVSYLIDLLLPGKNKGYSTIQVPVTQLVEYGLAPPQATIEIKLKNQQTHQLILGNPNFNKSLLYAQVDSPTQSHTKVNILLVSTDFENAVNRSLSEWKNPDASPSNSSEQKSNQPNPNKLIKPIPSISP